MIRKTINIILLCLSIIFYITQSFAFDKNKISIEKNNIYLKDANVADVQELYDFFDFPNYLDYFETVYPRIFINHLPKDYASIENQTYRNELFIKMLMPIILKVNHEFEEERKNLEAIQLAFYQEKDFHELDCYYIDKLAKKYEIATPYKDTRKYIALLEDLISRVDSVPPSILLATAAIYTDWGTSRVAIEANNLYKAQNWYTDDGLKPLSDDTDYTYKIYDSLEDSIRDYILKVNKSVDYRSFWHARTSLREKQEKYNDAIYGKRLVWSFVLENNLKNYAGLLDYTLTYYRMELLDQSELEAEDDTKN